MFKIHVQRSVQVIRETVDIQNRLQQRHKIEVEEFLQQMESREKSYQLPDYTPSTPTDVDKYLRKGTYYLDHINSNFHRFYLRK